MRSSRRMVRALALGTALALSAAACADDAAEPDEAAAEDEVTEDEDTDDTDDAEAEDTGDSGSAERRVLVMGGEAGEVATLDPHFATTGMDRQLMEPMYEGLVKQVPGDYSAGFAPSLATEVPETPEPNEDGTQVWEFTIVEGAMCHAGPDNDAYELTAEDVVASYEKARNPETSGFASEYDVVDSIEAVDDNTVAFHLSAPRSAELFLSTVSNYGPGFVICGQAIEGESDIAQHPVGTGPYSFVEYNPGNDIVFEAHDDYWGGTPKLAGIQMRFMPDESSRTLALQSGDIDFMYGQLEEEWVERIDSEDGLTAIAMPTGGLHTYSLNKTIEPFDDINVRKAIFYAQDRDSHVAINGESLYERAYALEPYPGHPGSLTFEEAQEQGLDYEYDPDRARELLAEAGYPDGFEFSVVSSEFPTYSDHYQVLQGTLADVGIDMDVEIVDHATYHELIRAGNNAITLYRAPREMEFHLRHFAHSDAIVRKDTAITNFSFFDGADDLIEEASSETDSQRQAELWKEANVRILEDAAIKTSTHSNNTYGWVDEFEPGHEPISTRSVFTIDENTGFTD